MTIKFSKKIKEFRYEANFYKGKIIESYKTIFDEKVLNKLVYNLTIKDDNFNSIKLKEYKELIFINKIIKWLGIGTSIGLTLIGFMVMVPFVIVLFRFLWYSTECEKDKYKNLDFPGSEDDIKEIHSGKYLSERNKMGVYSNVTLDFFENKKLVYEYIFFEVKCYKGKYYWKEVQEVAMIYLNSLEKINYLPEGIEIEGRGYFERYDGKRYYKYPKIFIPSYITDYDKILEIFKDIDLNKI